MNKTPNQTFPLTAEEAEQAREPYIPWHPHELSPERKRAWHERERERELAEFRARRHKRMAELGMTPSDVVEKRNGS